MLQVKKGPRIQKQHTPMTMDRAKRLKRLMQDFVIKFIVIMFVLLKLKITDQSLNGYIHPDIRKK